MDSNLWLSILDYITTKPIIILSISLTLFVSLVLTVFATIIYQEHEKEKEKVDALDYFDEEEMELNRHPYTMQTSRTQALRQRSSHSTDSVNMKFGATTPIIPINRYNNNNQTKPPYVSENINNNLYRQQQVHPYNTQLDHSATPLMHASKPITIPSPVLSENTSKQSSTETAVSMSITEGFNERSDKYLDSNQLEDTASNQNVPSQTPSQKAKAGLRHSKPLVVQVKPQDLVVGMTRRRSGSSSDSEEGHLSVSDSAHTTSCVTPPDSHSLSRSRSVSRTTSDKSIASTSSSKRSTLPLPTCPAVLQSIPYTDLSLTHVLGGGSFGQVWSGMWRGTPVAVKILSSGHLNISDTVLTAFEAEVAMLASLRHPNICLYLGACLTPPHRAIVTELVSRGALWQLLRTPSLFPDHRGPVHWPWWVVYRVTEDCVRGLVYLHSLSPPVLHRDMKSANLLLDDSFHVKICDFGLARLRQIDAEERGTMTAQVGTYQWMAPEVISGEADYAEAADIYSVSVVLWELLTGECPFEGHNAMQLANMVVSGARPIVPACTPVVLTQLIERGWSPSPDSRPTANELLHLLPGVFAEEVEKERNYYYKNSSSAS
mmetsp:Transcript_36247/g.36922  ORF Transcript_36247/g.36922 Transcript_36247/m.36922 type:complete len:603 (-) Transcript_36247:115-1923(-)